MRNLVHIALLGFNTLLFSQQVIHIKDVAVLTMVTENILQHQDVIISGGKIMLIQPTSDLPADHETVIIDGRGLYLMPGLSEMHAHIPVPQDEDDTYVRETLLLFLANGVTVIRGMLGNPYHLLLREDVKNGKIPGPRIYTSSPSLNGNSIPTAEIAREKVTQYARDGYDFLKIHPGIQLDVFREVVKTSRETGIRFAGHVPVDVGVRNAIDFGYWSIDHLDGYVEGLVNDEDLKGKGGFFGYQFTDTTNISLLSELVRMSAEKNIWQVPTQTLFTRWFSPTPAVYMIQEHEMDYIPARLRYSWVTNKERLNSDTSYYYDQHARFVNLRKKILFDLYEAKVPILLGSDSPQVMNVPGFSIHHEIDDMLDVGMPLYDVLLSGTANPARFFGMEGQFGTIVPGADADLVLVSGNPLDDHSVLRRPTGVMIQGNWYDRKALDQILEEIKERHMDKE